MSEAAKFRFLLVATIAVAIVAFLTLRPGNSTPQAPITQFSEDVSDAELDAFIAEMKAAITNAPALDPDLGGQVLGAI